MKPVALIHSGKSFLPEAAAYKAYIESLGVQADILVSPADSLLKQYRILWYFMGFDVHRPVAHRRQFVIHEYASASTPPFAKLKDGVKKRLNSRPDLRISLNPEHRNAVFPDDGTPLIIRRQGIHDCFFGQAPRAKRHDFIYTGSALSKRNTAVWLTAFQRKLPGASIVLTGNHEPGIVKQFSGCKNILFKEALPITALPALLAESRYAVNYLPDVYPFNIQPSTKLQEYCASGCQVISNRYPWVNSFADAHKAGIFFLESNFDHLSMESLAAFPYNRVNMESYRWENIFREMHLRDIICNT